MAVPVDEHEVLDRAWRKLLERGAWPVQFVRFSSTLRQLNPHRERLRAACRTWALTGQGQPGKALADLREAMDAAYQIWKDNGEPQWPGAPREPERVYRDGEYLGRLSDALESARPVLRETQTDLFTPHDEGTK